MKLLRWALYALAILVGLAGIYLFTLGDYFVFIGVGCYVLCWLIAWFARRV